LKDINLRVSEASKNLRIERVHLIKLKVKEVLGKDVNISIKDVNTDVKVQPNLNDVHTTEGIVSSYSFVMICDVINYTLFQPLIMRRNFNPFSQFTFRLILGFWRQ
jgi:hypothetical protein